METFSFTEMQTTVTDVISKTPAPGRHAARSAISHIERAWKLCDVDPEMAVFRGITAEEESVTAIFHSLRRLRYSGSEKLNLRSHVQKATLHPFLLAIENLLSVTVARSFKTSLEIDLDDEIPKFKTRITVQHKDGSEGYLYPIPPLNFSLELDGKIHDFESELLQLTKQQTLDKVVEYIKKQANRRNQVLYASQEGIPKLSSSPQKFILGTKDRVFRNLMLYLLIDPYPFQSFVQQALMAFLRMQGLLPRELESEIA